MNRGLKTPIKRHNIELPMSPQCTSSNIGLDDIQNRYLNNYGHYSKVNDFLPFFQPGNNICQDAWVSKSQNRKCIFSKSNTAIPLGTVFKKMNSPDYINSDSTSALITGKDSGSGNKIKEPLFGILQETAVPNDTYDESGHSFLTLSEDGRQLIHNSPSVEHCSTFVNHSSISQLFTDPADMNEISNKCSPYNREIYNMTKCTEMYTVDRCLKGIFTGPEQTFFISKNISSGSHKENEQPDKGHLKEYHKGLYCLISSENQDNPSKFERTGKYFAMHAFYCNYNKSAKF
uniref:Uncharacterized protein n=1 Tax=Pelusios castaneus TaxID=367368 RepID=A0A8C8SIM3_9SAUR